MNALQEKLIDYCIDNQKADPKDVAKYVSGLIGAKYEALPSIDHSKKSIVSAFGLSDAKVNAYVDEMNAIIRKHERTSAALEEILDTIPKHVILLNLHNSVKHLGIIKVALKSQGIIIGGI